MDLYCKIFHLKGLTVSYSFKSTYDEGKALILIDQGFSFFRADSILVFVSNSFASSTWLFFIAL
jgi:hypothetical protein